VRSGLPQDIILHVDRLWRSFVSDYTGDLGIPVIAPPSEAYDEHGLLKQCFWNPRQRDDRHANEAYGELIVERIVKHMKSVVLRSRAVGFTGSAPAPSRSRARARSEPGAVQAETPG
jgi:hypothetical protein